MVTNDERLTKYAAAIRTRLGYTDGSTVPEEAARAVIAIAEREVQNMREAALDIDLALGSRAEAAEAKVARVEALLESEYSEGAIRVFLGRDIRAVLDGPPELEYPDLAYAVQKGGPNLDGPTVLTDEPTGDAMRWTKDDDK